MLDYRKAQPLSSVYMGAPMMPKAKNPRRILLARFGHMRLFADGDIVSGDEDNDGDIDDPFDPCGDDDHDATLYIDDAIGGWDGIQSKMMVKVIDSITANHIHLQINSPGGDVFEARAIKTALEQHPARVTATITGVAASAASFVMLAADNIRIARGAFVMIHNAWGYAMGDHREMMLTANLLQQISGTIAQDYATKTGLDPQTIAKMMDDETWLEANEAVSKGFCNSILEKPAKSAKFDLSVFKNAPKAHVSPKIDEKLLAAQQQHRARLRALSLSPV